MQTINDIGSQLRQAREAHGLSLQDIQKATRIKLVFLEAIEAGRFDELPGPVQARGFVRSYANRVGLDPDTLLAHLNGVGREPVVAGSANRSTPAPRSVPAPTRSAASQPPLPLPLPILILGVIALFAIGGLLLIQAFRGETPAPSPTQPASLPMSISRSQSPEPTPSPQPPAGVSLTLTASEHVWVRVTGDGFTAFEGILKPGQPQTWQADQQVIVETGNGAALNVGVNGQDVGVLGPRNRVVIRAWGVTGEVTPAPTAIPPTPEPSVTPAP